MHIRQAISSDIPQIQWVRNSVTENTLSDPALVTDADCLHFMEERGKGWVYEVNNRVVGFSIVDLREHNVWALFIHPDFEGRGIGRILHDTMIDWYFEQTQEPIWLGTSPGTRAAQFYEKCGWKCIGMHGEKELKFEMGVEDWNTKRTTPHS